MDPNSEKVLRMMEKMKLSETEKTSVKVGGVLGAAQGRRDPQAVAKVLSDRPIRAEVIEATLGKIWCPSKGVECRDLGENHFLITLLQVSGKRRALDDGPWMVGRNLVVVVDFDGAKTIDEVVFSSIHIWVRITKMPLGLMTRAAGEVIGELIGKVVEVDAEEDGSAVGKFMRIKIRLDITKPLMRGVTIDVGDGDDVKPLWCPLCYEFLPDFCYTCGIIGHTDRVCDKKLEKGEVQQFSRALRFIPEKKQVSSSSSIRSGEKFVPGFRKSSGGAGSGGSWGNRGSGSLKGSDAPSWRRMDPNDSGADEEEEVTSPLKAQKALTTPGDARKSLVFTPQPVEVGANAVDPPVANKKKGDGPEAEKVSGVNVQVKEAHVNSAMLLDEEQRHAASLDEGKNPRTFKRYPRGPRDDLVPMEAEEGEGRKRGREDGEDMEVEVHMKVKFGRDEKAELQSQDLAEPMD